MTATNIPVASAYSVSVAPASDDTDGFLLCLLVLRDGRVVDLDPSDHDVVYANMEVLRSAYGSRLLEPVSEPGLLARYADGYEVES